MQDPHTLTRATGLFVLCLCVCISLPFSLSLCMYVHSQRAKKLARSEISTRQWDRYKFSEINLDEALGPVQDNCERISCHAVTSEEFRQRFEVH